ncbi:DUF3617 domain-containing protein [Sphingomonas alba]|uniref:DUF3617 domain-containing protein n=1 Tax=Sphingomonas alba TaxID=2908208 RepID=A0ABT0RNF1_9SPHN|nr:DUF3617 domain-containing protein [Sphingomonas alba]MCL6684045.1 DUF3617 domain-containing protein [Sphingomonas alba]
MKFWSIIPLLALTACGDSDKVEMKNASVSEVAKTMEAKGAADSFIDPGAWEQTVTFVSMEAPGMPPEAKDMMARAMGKTQVHDVCLTEDKAKNPRADFFAGADKNCRYEHFKWGGGKIDLKLDCQHPNAHQVMELTGNYQPQSYEMAMTMTNEGKEPGEHMVMKMRVDAKRTGACTAEQLAAAKQEEKAP